MRINHKKKWKTNRCVTLHFVMHVCLHPFVHLTSPDVLSIAATLDKTRENIFLLLMRKKANKDRNSNWTESTTRDTLLSLAASPPDARTGWKVSRVMKNHLGFWQEKIYTTSHDWKTHITIVKEMECIVVRLHVSTFNGSGHLLTIPGSPCEQYSV